MTQCEMFLETAFKIRDVKDPIYKYALFQDEKETTRFISLSTGLSHIRHNCTVNNIPYKRMRQIIDCVVSEYRRASDKQSELLR